MRARTDSHREDFDARSTAPNHEFTGCRRSDVQGGDEAGCSAPARRQKARGTRRQGAGVAAPRPRGAGLFPGGRAGLAGSYQRSAAQSRRQVAQTPRARHSALMLAARTTLPHLSVSSERKVANSAGPPVIAVLPMLASRALIFGSVKAVLISLLSIVTIPVGVPLGAQTPLHELAS